jgi:hypothetical protein
MPLIPRADKDAAAMPDSKAEQAALADFTDPRSSYDKDPGFYYERTLGDLIVEALVGRDLCEDVADSPEAWEPFDRALLKRTALELKVLNNVLAVEGGLMADDHDADPLSQVEICEILRGITRRAQAGAELSSRLREARWGHPCFGGGDNYAVHVTAKGIRFSEREELRHAAIAAARSWTKTREGKPGEYAFNAFETFWEQWSKDESPKCTREQAHAFHRAVFRVAVTGGTGDVRDPMRPEEAVVP